MKRKLLSLKKTKKKKKKTKKKIKKLSWNLQLCVSHF
jgi:hypothetical protein